MQSINRSGSARYGVVGNPVGHSKSPAIHMAFAAAAGQDITYETIEAGPGGFRAAVDGFRAAGGRGLNVTTPFKLEAAAYVTELRERARLAGAVNAMLFEDGRAIGDNFDGVGLIRDILRLGGGIAGRRVLLLGAGGAARGAVLPFLAERPAALVVANRDLAKATALAGEMEGRGPVTAIGYAELGGQAPFDIVVNATSASLHGTALPVPAGSFGPGCLAYEMVYGRGLTPFLVTARRAGAGTLADGVGMLVEQAAEAFAWWRGVRPETGPVIAAMTVPLVGGA